MHESIATTLGLGRGTSSILNTSLNALSPHVRDGANSILIGTVFDLTRRVFGALWSWFSRTFTTTATFESGNEAFDWISEWLEKQPGYSTSKEFDVVAKPRARTLSNVIVPPGMRGMLNQSRPSAKDGPLAQYLPSHDTLHWMFYGSRLIRVKRSRMAMGADYGPSYNIERITLTLFAFSHTALQGLIEKAALDHRARDLAEIQINIGDQYGNWKRLSSKPHRDFGSVVLEPEIKRKLLEDANDFLENERWYADRGIPYRRGYLLYGTPGSGKSSSIHALASELRLDIYVVPLSLKTIDDSVLADLISNTPDRCILLYEDIDTAFVDRLATPATEQQTTNARGETTSGSGVTLSGLLNTIDGVQAQEGRLLFATTNHPERLDQALSRPGRMDVKIEYCHSTQWQAEQLFRLFYPLGQEAEKTLLDKHAQEFASAVPPKKLSVAQLQGYLMRYKGQPEQAAKNVVKWIEEELAKQS
ncbi:P-loop nucleoside triphosphate hydrolase, putative [Rhizoctonia solani AG-3 Rhs1AP]|uniref:p-loop nucleoside triphosphate hydrolase, putative n=1 Tax=Rhizoctonia solani AG-3 Rhs1AP TaxID=1086054 RepID=A0A0A1UKF4_9AGAM|nr:P-loop nucleoside triphosphate hydrolase, putative [Rhizoctonia solani AG-3 Rhs1AP]